MSLKKRLSRICGFAGLLFGLMGSSAAQSIYTCVDDNGRRLTSDRPIAACMDRVQRELNPSGSLRRVLTPPPPAKSREQLVAEEKAESEVRMRRAEEIRNDRALRIRYPDRASHDEARAAALAQVSDVIKTATERTQELTDQRVAIAKELDFYKNLPGKVPPTIKRRIDETDVNIAAQKRLIADKEVEKTRLTKRFDAEFAKLQPQWRVGSASGNIDPKP